MKNKMGKVTTHQCYSPPTSVTHHPPVLLTTQQWYSPPTSVTHHPPIYSPPTSGTHHPTVVLTTQQCIGTTQTHIDTSKFYKSRLESGEHHQVLQIAVGKWRTPPSSTNRGWKVANTTKFYKSRLESGEHHQSSTNRGWKVANTTKVLQIAVGKWRTPPRSTIRGWKVANATTFYNPRLESGEHHASNITSTFQIVEDSEDAT
ncbi:hypothetical protein Bpfe_003153 [Biomphalaria pfeifferi]|uniref:Uncharacterized protein n=1 Tax=Biomphalaria pfeifferi TaxID=112525 RepID=A0AAD8C709_BIOPF|nr:hypothetical protein Bpfe_003153 [Biomphalaria pfeifferi]